MDYAYVFVIVEIPIIPSGYTPSTISSPENVPLRVFWGSLATQSHEFGSALRVGDKWYWQNQKNIHWNGKTCATPTGWYKE